MATTVHMEALSPTMEEGRLVKWVKHEGDAVASGDTLAEVETDKAVMELVARADGMLLKVLVGEGMTVPVGAVVAWIGKAGEAIPGGGGAPAAVPAAPAVARAPVRREPLPAPRTAPAPAGRLKASPLARRLADERGVDLRQLVGSGPGGRVTKRDVETAGRGEKADVRPLPETPAVARGMALPSPLFPGDPFEDVPLTQIRKTIAHRLVSSLGPVPHFFLTIEVDMTRAAEAREAVNRDLGEQGKISFNDILVKATALALTRHRACNAWYQDDHIRYWNEVHLGMAVAVADGLIVPVIRHADRKSLLQIGTEARALADKARNRRLTPAEYTGATFSISNLGMFDIDRFTAIINPPEAGIIAVGTIAPQPAVVNEQVVVRRQVRLTMSCDHRVIDGATGAAFLSTLKQMLENPLAMLL